MLVFAVSLPPHGSQLMLSSVGQVQSGLNIPISTQHTKGSEPPFELKPVITLPFFARKPRTGPRACPPHALQISALCASLVPMSLLRIAFILCTCILAHMAFSAAHGAPIGKDNESRRGPSPGLDLFSSTEVGFDRSKIALRGSTAAKSHIRGSGTLSTQASDPHSYVRFLLLFYTFFLFELESNV